MVLAVFFLFATCFQVGLNYIQLYTQPWFTVVVSSTRQSRQTRQQVSDSTLILSHGWNIFHRPDTRQTRQWSLDCGCTLIHAPRLQHNFINYSTRHPTPDTRQQVVAMGRRLSIPTTSLAHFSKWIRLLVNNVANWPFLTTSPVCRSWVAYGLHQFPARMYSHLAGTPIRTSAMDSSMIWHARVAASWAPVLGRQMSISSWINP